MREMRRTQRSWAGYPGQDPVLPQAWEIAREIAWGMGRRRGLSLASPLAIGLLVGGLGLIGCQVSEPYLLPARTVEMLSTLQPDLRPGAQLPAVRERDRAPSLVRRRALGLSEAELAQATAKKSRFYRVRASERPPMYYVGGVVLGMALPPLLIGLMTGLDPVWGSAPTRAITDVAGGGLMMALAGLHLGAGGLLLALGDRRPQVEPADRGLVQQYVDGTVPLLISGPPPAKEGESPADGSDPSAQPGAGDPSAPPAPESPAP